MAYSDHGGINLVAHVSGGVAGYLYGFSFLKNHREETQDELNDEIEYMKSTRNKPFSTTSSYKGRRQISTKYPRARRKARVCKL
jgi:hypothetical protein